jgi:hypothetical protein
MPQGFQAIDALKTCVRNTARRFSRLFQRDAR